MVCKTEITNAEQLRELALNCKSFDEFQDKAVNGVLKKMTLAEFRIEAELHNSADLQDYYEKLNKEGKE